MAIETDLQGPPHTRAGRIILLHRASSSGKSTLSKAIQRALDEPFIHFSSDYLALGLPERRERSGAIWPRSLSLTARRPVWLDDGKTL
jgi:chloramphenicol 3-O-phosphotransferase